MIAADIETIHPKIFDSGRYYFQSLENAFDEATNQALHEIAITGQTGAGARVTERLVDYEYIEAIGDNWHFKVPLLREWWGKWTVDS